MHLDDVPFCKIADGAKTIELRLYDERRRAIKVGDNLLFVGKRGTLSARVTALHVFDSFQTLYRTLDLLKCGYSPGELSSAHPDDMLQYYSAEQQRKWGVVGVQFELLPVSGK